MELCWKNSSPRAIRFWTWPRQLNTRGALLLGAESAVGVDIDPLAVKTAISNADINGVGENFTGICGDLAEKVSGKFNVVLANIAADIAILLSRRTEIHV